MAGRMRVQLFKARQQDQATPVEKVIEQISKDEIEDRLRLVADKRVRLEDVEKRGSDDDPHWVLNFTLLRFDHGPGKSHIKKKTEGFRLERDEGFGEETAALFLPKTGHLVLQYNHFGPRIGTIQNYLNAYLANDVCGCDFQVIYDKGVEQKLLKKQHFSSISVGMAVSKVTAADKQDGMILEEAIDKAEMAGANIMDIRFSMGPGKNDGLDNKFVTQTVNAIQKLMKRNKASVRKAEVAGKADNESRMEIINLINPTLTVDFDDLEIGTDRRYPVADRWERLSLAAVGWSKQIEDTA